MSDTDEFDEEKVVLQWRVGEWFPGLGEQKIADLRFYYDELRKFNQTINLVSAKTLINADAVHFADSILAASFIAKNLKFNSIYDLGSGNGFPGLVMGIIAPDKKVTLVDSDSRKIEFLKHVSTGLKLKNVSTICGRVEELDENSIETAVSRGFANLTKALLSARRAIKAGGKFYHLKGERWASEVAEIPSQLCRFWSPALLGTYKIPTGGITTAIVKTDRLED